MLGFFSFQLEILNFSPSKTVLRTLAVTSFGSTEIALHTCDVFKGEHDDESFESHEDPTGTA